MSIEEHVRAVRARIDAAARAAGRDPGEITLCAATKVQTSDAIRQVIAAGVPCRPVRPVPADGPEGEE